jgi:UDP-GlcNAc:undecaprenyl-phosphate/decaprenyl-phosphate GlcNAc-1-phosphate transferase
MIMNSYTQLVIPIVGSLALVLLIIPIIKKAATKLGLMDKPNARKVHSAPVPLAGGISIALTTIIALLLNPQFINHFAENAVWISGAMIILVIGALDDRFDIKPLYRLVIQLGCAFAVAWSGVRITSFQGLFGIETIPLIAQYGLTMIVIAGVVNAYNLMDGIDGLMGGLSLVSSLILGVISYQFNRIELSILCFTVAGAVIGFLKHNLSRKKLFMGDAGSLFLGFLLVVVAIKLLNTVDSKNATEGIKVLLVISGIFLVPVLDSLRVYRERIKKGGSPFKADKTHLHHLFIFLGITHKRATLLIVILSCVILGIMTGLTYFIPIIWVIIAGVSVFIGVTAFLTINHSVQEWRDKIKELERS